MTPKKKLLLIGWDAADWQIINPLLRQGKLPALSRLMNRAAWGNLATLDPPISPMLWTSIATGKRPYKHGINGFTELTQDGKTVRPVRVTSRTCKAIWNILNDNNYKTNIVGWWPSHPAEKVDGVCVSNFFAVAPSKDSEEWLLPKGAIFPEDFEQDLKKLRVHPKELTTEIMSNFFPNAETLNSDNDAILRSAMRIVSHASTVHAAATYVLENTEWDFMAVYYDALDHFSHLGMKYHPPKLSGISEEDYKNYNYIIEGAYRFHDMMLDRLLDLAGDACNVILVSDHGFESGVKRIINLPEEPGAPAMEHRPYGVFIANGPDFIPGQIYGASLLDITPTVLALFGLPQANDIDGKVIQDAVNQHSKSVVESYETSKNSEQKADNVEEIDTELLEQLKALGYIEKIETKADKRVALSENEYYLARSLADGGKFDQALKISEKLAKAFPDILRYSNFLASLLLRLGKRTELENWIKINKKEGSFSSYMQGMLYLQEGRYLLAAKNFEALIDKANPNILFNIASAWSKTGDNNRAAEFAHLALQVDPDHVHASNLLGDVDMHNKQWEAALSRFFQSLKLMYYQPATHEKIGTCLFELKHYKEAAQAFEVSLQMNPFKSSVIQQLTELYSEFYKNKSRLDELNKNMVEYATVVSGFPRSGTSMMMQILKDGGKEIVTDFKRLEDKFNPMGYFELEAVKSATYDQSFLQEAIGKTIKIVMPLLRFIEPLKPLKVIWMQRELTKIVQSQERMKGVNSVDISHAIVAKMNSEISLMEEWLNRHPHVSYLKVNYDDVLIKPEQSIQRIARFLNEPLDQPAMISAIKTELKHF